MEKELYDEKFNTVNARLKNHENRISATEDKIVETDKSLAVSIKGINSSLEMLVVLPAVISKVSETITKMGSTLELMQAELKRNTKAIADLEKDTAEKIRGVQSDIHKIDEEGKFNLRLWIKDNWIKLILGGSAIGALIKYLVG